MPLSTKIRSMIGAFGTNRFMLQPQDRSALSKSAITTSKCSLPFRQEQQLGLSHLVTKIVAFTLRERRIYWRDLPYNPNGSNMEAKMKYVTSKDGTKLAYDVTGSGPPLICITGASCFRNFPPILKVVKVLSKHFTVYNYDRRGRGDSSDTAPYSISKEVDDLEVLIDACGGKALLYGHSSGAVLALEAALRLDEKIDQVIVYDPPYVHTKSDRAKYQALAAEVMKQLSQKNNKRAMKTFLSGIGMPKFFVLFLPLFPGWREMHTLAPTLAYDIELTKDFPPLNRFKEIKIPTLVLVGSKSPESVRAVGEEIAKAIPAAAFEIIAGQDHLVNAKVLLPKFTRFFGTSKA